MQLAAKIAPCLWFNDQAEAAVDAYTAIFPDSEKRLTAYYSEVGREFHGHEPGSVMTIDFTLAGLPFTALNGGPQFHFSEAISFQVYCDDQAEIDHYGSALSEAGAEQPCGWLRDRFGVSWQVVPAVMLDWMEQGSEAQLNRMMGALFTMTRLDMAALERAYQGTG